MPARLGGIPRLAAGSSAFGAMGLPFDFHLFFSSLKGLLQGQLDLQSQVFPLLRPTRLALAGTGKNRIESEKDSQDVAEIGKNRVGKKTEVGSAPPVSQSFGTVLVVDLPLFGIAQHRVGFRRLLEFFLGLEVFAVSVGMALESQLPIGFLDFGDRSV